jgi:hypothetical protein
MAWLGVVDKLNAVPGNDPEPPLETEVRRTTFLLVSAAFIVAEPLTALLNAGLDVGTRRVVEPQFGDRSGDPALQAMVALSALPSHPRCRCLIPRTRQPGSTSARMTSCGSRTTRM